SVRRLPGSATWPTSRSRSRPAPGEPLLGRPVQGAEVLQCAAVVLVVIEHLAAGEALRVLGQGPLAELGPERLARQGVGPVREELGRLALRLGGVLPVELHQSALSCRTGTVGQ